MEQALYHPQWGYYSSGRAAIGRSGDYFTNVSVGPLFGRMLAAQFAEMWDLLGQPETFTLVEQGANHGDFAADVLGAAIADWPAFANALQYCIVEPFSVLEQRQREKLAASFAHVTWRKGLEELEPFTGAHFSNELLDAMPVHLIQRGDAGWNELFVDEQFQFVAGPLSIAELEDHLPAVEIGHATEVNLASRAWLNKVSAKLTRGFVLAADYGLPRPQFFAAERTTGTLRCYRNHQIVESPFTGVGSTDITAHVEWTSVAEHGLTRGLALAGFTDQHHFLSALATGLCREMFGEQANASTRRMLQTLLHPTMLGRTFQFLAFSRGVGPGAKLDGFRLARDPAVSLGLVE